MKAKTALLLPVVLGCLLSMGTPAARAGGDPLPDLFYFTQAWQNDFEVSVPRCDRARGLIVWQLKAKKKVKSRAYDALFADADGVEMALVRVRLDPVRAEYPRGAILQATVKLPPKGVLAEVNKLNIQTSSN